MASILQYALDYPKMWRKISTDKASIAAVKKLEAAGLVELKTTQTSIESNLNTVKIPAQLLTLIDRPIADGKHSW